MKPIIPTRGTVFALVMAAGVCASAAVAQSRHGGGGQSYHRSAPAYRQAAPAYHQMAPEYRMAPSYRQMYAPQQEYRPQGQPERYGQQSPAPVERRAPQPQGQPYRGQPQVGPVQRPQGQGVPRGEHLAEWMNQHRNLTPQQQQQALDREPGFHNLPQQTQQRYRNELARLNAMSPERRQRILEYNEHMERLPVEQRAEVRGALQQLGALPPDQRRQVAQSWRQLRMLPPEQRGAALNSPQLQWMNPAQRSALNNLLRVEPLLPPTEQAPR